MAMRSFTDPPGLKNSILAYKGQGRYRSILLRRTRGVFPMACKISSYTRRDSEEDKPEEDMFFSSNLMSGGIPY
jgi:hypothetical protein